MKIKLGVFNLVLFAIAAALVIKLIRSEHREKPAAAAQVEVKPHIHQWSKWSEPAKSSDWYNGTWFTQARTCDLCGEAQIREVKISAGGGK